MATLQELAELVGEDVEEDADTLDLEDKELSEVPAAVCSLEAVEEVCASKTAKSICPELALLSRAFWSPVLPIPDAAGGLLPLTPRTGIVGPRFSAC